MSEELKGRKAMRIVAAMKKSAVFLLFFLVAAPAFAQTGQQFGILLGGVKRMYSSHDRRAGVPENNVAGVDQDLPINGFHLTHGAHEAFYAVQVESSTWFKIQAGEWNTDVGIVRSGKDKDGNPTGESAKFPVSGKVRHADAIVDYRFTEAYGSTGIFGGIGFYRWSPSGPAPDAAHDVPTQSQFGYTFGINGEFPMTKRYAFMLEGAYHWINMSSPVRYVTVMGGVRVGF